MQRVHLPPKQTSKTTSIPKPLSHQKKKERKKETHTPEAPFSEGRDDQPGGVAQVLVAVLQAGRDHVHLHELVHPVVTQLRHPREVLVRRNVFADQFLDYVAPCGDMRVCS